MIGELARHVHLPIASPAGILFILAGNAALWFFLSTNSKSKVFHFLPPLIFIYSLPAVFSNTGLIALESPLYDWMGEDLLPFFLVLLLLDVDVVATVRVMGKGIFVMLLGTLGVVIGAPIGFLCVKHWLGPEAWKGFGALAGSWIGGTGNMVAVGNALQTPDEYNGLAIISDNLVFLVWLPLLLQSKNLAGWFNRKMGVADARVDNLKEKAGKLTREKGPIQVHHLLYLVAIGFGVAWLGSTIAAALPEAPPVLTTGTYRILIVTTLALIASFTPARHVPGSHEMGMALVYLFVARMGAKASVAGLADEALPFVAGAYIWIFIHGAFILGAAWLFRIDIHTAAIASAANIGGAASAPIVAAFHDERLVPVSVLMALIGYAIGNYGAFVAAWLCHLVS